MKKLEIIKRTLQYTASIGTGMVVSRGVKANIPAPTGALSGIAFKVGTYGLAGLAGERIFTYVGQEFDDFVEIFRSIDQQTKEKK